MSWIKNMRKILKTETTDIFLLIDAQELPCLSELKLRNIIKRLPINWLRIRTQLWFWQIFAGQIWYAETTLKMIVTTTLQLKIHENDILAPSISSMHLWNDENESILHQIKYVYSYGSKDADFGDRPFSIWFNEFAQGKVQSIRLLNQFMGRPWNVNFKNQQWSKRTKSEYYACRTW